MTLAFPTNFFLPISLQKILFSSRIFFFTHKKLFEFPKKNFSIFTDFLSHFFYNFSKKNYFMLGNTKIGRLQKVARDFSEGTLLVALFSTCKYHIGEGTL